MHVYVILHASNIHEFYLSTVADPGGGRGWPSPNPILHFLSSPFLPMIVICWNTPLMKILDPPLPHPPLRHNHILFSHWVRTTSAYYEVREIVYESGLNQFCTCFLLNLILLSFASFELKLHTEKQSRTAT